MKWKTIVQVVHRVALIVEEEKKTPHLEDLICDCCNRSVEKLFKYVGSQYCAECILEDFEEINEDNFFRIFMRIKKMTKKEKEN